MGLRSLAPEHPDYKRTYHGDLKTRDAAYHQGTVWSWLIGPFVDAWLKVHARTQGRAAARELLTGLEAHLGEAGIGSISEVFDAEPPYTAAGLHRPGLGRGRVAARLVPDRDLPRSGSAAGI